jgi:hypothetical protein
MAVDALALLGSIGVDVVRAFRLAFGMTPDRWSSDAHNDGRADG